MNQETIRKIIDDHEAGRFPKQIARELGVDNRTVTRVLSGEYSYKGGQIVRCPECRQLVYWPCRLCAVRREKGGD